jgi:hypothetical protein
MKQTIKPIHKPEGFRDWLAHKLVRLAYWIKPDNEAGKAYLMDLAMENELERMKYGRSFMEIKIKKNRLTNL